MKRVAVLLLLLAGSPLSAGTVDPVVDWISNATPAAELVPSNDDYVGTFEDNPNRFDIGGLGVIGEFIVPTLPSGGTTEYAFAAGANGSSFDNIYYVEVGFGLGDTFVNASELNVDLRFDSLELVSPEISARIYFRNPPDRLYPSFWLVDRSVDTLIYQGSTHDGNGFTLYFHHPYMLQLPLDIPDLELWTRDYYTAESLAGLNADHRPFTVRMVPLYGEPDFNGDDFVKPDDVDTLTQAIRSGSTESVFDLDYSGAVDMQDREVLIKAMLNTYYGDADLNREFSSEDMVKVFQAGQYEDDLSANSSWASGDWNGDLEFDSDDFVLAFQDGGYEQGRRGPGPWVDPQAVPEPSGILLAVIGMLGLFNCSRRVRLS